MPVLYTKCSSIVSKDVGLQEWNPHQFVAWYWNIDGELVRPLKGFDSPSSVDAIDGMSMGEVLDP